METFFTSLEDIFYKYCKIITRFYSNYIAKQFINSYAKLLIVFKPSTLIFFVQTTGNTLHIFF